MPCLVMLNIVLIISGAASLVATRIGAHNTISVQPDDVLCAQPSCHPLQYFIENSNLYFVSNTTFYFAEGEYFHNHSDLIAPNITNFSLIGTPNSSDPTVPLSVIKYLPKHSMCFYNVSNLLINDLKFRNCSRLLLSHNKNSQEIHWAALRFQYCINLEITNVYIYNSVGYGISADNVIGQNSL